MKELTLRVLPGAAYDNGKNFDRCTYLLGMHIKELWAEHSKQPITFTITVAYNVDSNDV